MSRAQAHSKEQHPEKYHRFNRVQRVQHFVLMISFTLLAVTGLPQMYATTGWGEVMVQALGGIEWIRLQHRWLATTLIVVSIFHLFEVAYKVFVLRVRLTMMPSWKDVTDAVQYFLYNVRLAKTPPQFPRYNFGEKAEYWAVIWGTVIMVITGFMLWNPIATTQFLPGQFIPAAKAAHGGEALLAVLSILTWHAYNVHIKMFNKSMFTGYLSREEMEEEHALELEELEKGRAEREPQTAPQKIRFRQRIFYPIAAVLTLACVVGLYYFLTFEQTAITTVPRQEVDVFVPATPQP
jgi:formate dehydrogenase gamma subunit